MEIDDDTCQNPTYNKKDNDTHTADTGVENRLDSDTVGTTPATAEASVSTGASGQCERAKDGDKHQRDDCTPQHA